MSEAARDEAAPSQTGFAIRAVRRSLAASARSLGGRLASAVRAVAEFASPRDACRVDGRLARARRFDHRPRRRVGIRLDRVRLPRVHPARCPARVDRLRVRAHALPRRRGAAAGEGRGGGARPRATARRERGRPGVDAVAARAAGRRGPRRVRRAGASAGRRARGALRRAHEPARRHRRRTGDHRCAATSSGCCGAPCAGPTPSSSSCTP